MQQYHEQAKDDVIQKETDKKNTLSSIQNSNSKNPRFRRRFQKYGQELLAGRDGGSVESSVEIQGIGGVSDIDVNQTAAETSAGKGPSS